MAASDAPAIELKPVNVSKFEEQISRKWLQAALAGDFASAWSASDEIQVKDPKTKLKNRISLSPKCSSATECDCAGECAKENCSALRWTHRQHSQAATAGPRQGRTRLCRPLLRRRQSRLADMLAAPRL